MGQHASHKAVGDRLKRAKGHLEKVIQMIENHEPCLNVAQQLHAVNRAIFNAKQTYVKDHIDHCLTPESLSDEQLLADAIEEFKEITKYLE